MKKRDFIFAVVLVTVFALVFLIIKGGNKGEFVTVSIDGNVTGSYALTEKEQVVAIGDNHILTIINNEAYMSYANCPDQICVNRGSISKGGEDIICMPNRVIVRVEGGADVEE